MVRYCGKPTKKPGHLCRWRVSESRCSSHGTPSSDGVTAAAIKQLEASPPGVTTEALAQADASPEPDAIPSVLVERDIAGVCWLIVERALGERPGDGRGGAVAVSALRILVGLPAAGLSAEEARTEAFLRGKIMHGIAPQTPADWELAAKIYDDEAIREFQRWELRERDDGYVDEPLALGEFAGDEAEPPVVVRDED